MNNQISDEQFIRAYRSAGLWFVGMYMEVFLLKKDNLDDDIFRLNLIHQIFNDGHNTFDKNIENTRTRVNSLRRIVNAKREIEALQLVVQSDRVQQQNPQAIAVAKDLISRIDSGEIKY